MTVGVKQVSGYFEHSILQGTEGVNIKREPQNWEHWGSTVADRNKLAPPPHCVTLTKLSRV